MTTEQKQLAIRLALADIGYLVRRSDNGRVITPPENRHDRIELSLLKSNKIIRLHDDYPLYIEGIAS